jgi:uncharacterized membrane protein
MLRELLKQPIKKKHIIALLVLLLPLWLIGINGFFFSSAAYQFVSSPEFMTEVSRQWVGDSDGILMTLVISVVITILWWMGVHTKHTDRFIGFFVNGVRVIKAKPRKALMYVGILFTLAIVAVFIEVIFSVNTSFISLVSAIRMLFFFSVGLSLYCIVVFRNSPERLFLFLSLTIGCLYIAAHPLMWYGWDNRIHYSWALEESFIWTVSVSEMDVMFSTVPEMHWFWSFDSTAADAGYSDWISGQTYTTLYTFRKGTDTLSEIGIGGHSYNFYTRLAYIPTGLMIFIGRSLSLPAIIIVKLGTLGNHLLYTIIVFFAIKRLNSGKHLMAVIAMFPTAFVLSTTYGYDHWVTAFTMLGFAYYFNELQNPKKKIKISTMIIMIGSFFVGVGPKAVYVPLMLILFFVKKDKFNTNKTRWLYMASVTGAIIFAVSSFALPFIITSGEGAADFRGEANVNAVAQAEFILRNPLAYARILWYFLKSYLNIPIKAYSVQNFTTNFAHLNPSSYYHLVWVLVLFVTLTDRNKNDEHTCNIKNKVVTSFVTLSTVALFSTALYIAFTDVASGHIAGVQGRYLFPVLFPFLYTVGSFKLQNNMNKTVYSTSVFAIISFVLLTGAWENLVP